MRCGWLKGNAPTVRSSKHILSHTPTRHSTGSISFNLKIVFREASDDENIISLTRVSENRPVAIYYRSFAPMYLYAATALSRPSSSTLLFTLLLVYLTLLWLPHHSPQYRFHHLSLPGPFCQKFSFRSCFGGDIWRAAKTGTRRYTPVTFGRQPAQVFSRPCRRTQSVVTQRRNFWLERLTD